MTLLDPRSLLSLQDPSSAALSSQASLPRRRSALAQLALSPAEGSGDRDRPLGGAKRRQRGQPEQARRFTKRLAITVAKGANCSRKDFPTLTSSLSHDGAKSPKKLQGLGSPVPTSARQLTECSVPARLLIQALRCKVSAEFEPGTARWSRHCPAMARGRNEAQTGSSMWARCHS